MRRWIFGAMALIPFLAVGEWAAGGPVLVYNATPSIAIAWYRWAPGDLGHGGTIEFESAITGGAPGAATAPTHEARWGHRWSSDLPTRG